MRPGSVTGNYWPETTLGDTREFVCNSRGGLLFRGVFRSVEGLMPGLNMAGEETYVAFEWVDEDTVYPVTAFRRDRER